VIFLKLAALLIGLGCCAARLLLLQFKPRPIWTMKGYCIPLLIAQELINSRSQDFVPPQPSAALYPSDEQPPSWYVPLSLPDYVKLTKQGQLEPRRRESPT
jgi:hypothetical protein